MADDIDAPTKAPKAAPAPARKVRYIVDEPRDKAVTSGFSTVIFRPGQTLEGAHILELARLNDVLIREV